MTSYWVQKLSEGWERIVTTRYPVLVVVPSGPDKITTEVLTVFANYIKANMLNFEEKYSGRLSSFIGRADIAEEIVKTAALAPVIVTNVEHFYNKWSSSERIDFIRHVLRRDGHYGIMLLLYCDENLSLIVK